MILAKEDFEVVNVVLTEKQTQKLGNIEDFVIFLIIAPARTCAQT